MLSNLKNYLELCRISNLPTIGTNTLSAFLLTGGTFSGREFPLLVLSLSLFYAGGMSLNDLCDLSYDRWKKPHRPLPEGRISPRGAFVFITLLFILALLPLSLLPYSLFASIAGIVLLLFIVTYDCFHRRHPFTVLLMAACRFMVYLIVSLGLKGTLEVYPLLAGSIQFIYIVFLSLVARYENRRKEPFPFPLIPYLLSAISLIDGVLLTILVHPLWFIAGLGGFSLTLLGQRYVRGD